MVRCVFISQSLSPYIDKPSSAEESIRTYGEVIPNSVSNQRNVVIKQAIGPVYIATCDLSSCIRIVLTPDNSPWNFPSAMITRKLCPALAAGCTVVIKPSEETPFSAVSFTPILPPYADQEIARTGRTG